MSSSKLIVILGATGNQGGSIADVFLNEAGWRVRAVTRNPSGGKAQALAARGAEVVQADLDNPSTLAPAFENATAIFAETQQLKGLIDTAAKVPTLERFILSSLSNATKWSKGKYTHVYHFDSKAKAENYAREAHPNLWAKTTIFQAGFFLSNLGSNPITKPQRAADGTIQFIGSFESGCKLPWLAAEEDTGPLVRALMEEPAGTSLIGYREELTLRELADAFTKATGMKAEMVTLPKGHSHLSLPPDLAEEMDDNWGYWNEFGYYGGDPSITHPNGLRKAPKLESVADYFSKQDWAKVLGES